MSGGGWLATEPPGARETVWKLSESLFLATSLADLLGMI